MGIAHVPIVFCTHMINESCPSKVNSTNVISTKLFTKGSLTERDSPCNFWTEKFIYDIIRQVKMYCLLVKNFYKKIIS